MTECLHRAFVAGKAIDGECIVASQISSLDVNHLREHHISRARRFKNLEVACAYAFNLHRQTVRHAFLQLVGIGGDGEARRNSLALFDGYLIALEHIGIGRRNHAVIAGGLVVTLKQFGSRHQSDGDILLGFGCAAHSESSARFAFDKEFHLRRTQCAGHKHGVAIFRTIVAAPQAQQCSNSHKKYILFHCDVCALSVSSKHCLAS